MWDRGCPGEHGGGLAVAVVVGARASASRSARGRGGPPRRRPRRFPAPALEVLRELAADERTGRRESD